MSSFLQPNFKCTFSRILKLICVATIAVECFYIIKPMIQLINKMKSIPQCININTTSTNASIISNYRYMNLSKELSDEINNVNIPQNYKRKYSDNLNNKISSIHDKLSSFTNSTILKNIKQRNHRNLIHAMDRDNVSADIESVTNKNISNFQQIIAETNRSVYIQNGSIMYPDEWDKDIDLAKNEEAILIWYPNITEWYKDTKSKLTNKETQATNSSSSAFDLCTHNVTYYVCTSLNYTNFTCLSKKAWEDLKTTYWINEGYGLFESVSTIISMIVAIYIAYQLYFHLYVKRHNWLTKPSFCTKLISVLCPISYFIYALCQNIFLFTGDPLNVKYITLSEITSSEIFAQTISDLSLYIGKLCVYLFFIFQINDFIKDDEFEQGISKKLLIFTIFLLIFNVIVWITFEILYITELTTFWLDPTDQDHGFSNKHLIYMYQIIYGISWKIIYSIIIDISLLLTYIHGFDKICHFWSEKNFGEFLYCGETERGHENFIRMSRIFIIFCIFLVFDMIYIVINGIFNPYNNILNFFGTFEGPDFNGFLIGSILQYYLVKGLLDNIPVVINIYTIYYIYEFGHVEYEKIFGCCQRRIQVFCKNRHRLQREKIYEERARAQFFV